MTDSRNWTVALKARVDNCEQMESAIFELTESLGLVTSQEDIYFDVPHGQLKLRIVHPNVRLFSFHAQTTFSLPYFRLPFACVQFSDQCNYGQKCRSVS